MIGSPPNRGMCWLHFVQAITATNKGVNYWLEVLRLPSIKRCAPNGRTFFTNCGLIKYFDFYELPTFLRYLPVGFQISVSTSTAQTPWEAIKGMELHSNYHFFLCITKFLTLFSKKSKNSDETHSHVLKTTSLCKCRTQSQQEISTSSYDPPRQ